MHKTHRRCRVRGQGDTEQRKQSIIMKRPTTSYQNDSPVYSSVPRVREDGSDKHSCHLVVRLFPALFVVGTLVGCIVTFKGQSSSPSPTLEQAGGILGSSHKSNGFSGLHLKGYPPTFVQQEYMKDLEAVDWKELEKDIEALLTDSKECTYLLNRF